MAVTSIGVLFLMSRSAVDTVVAFDRYNASKTKQYWTIAEESKELINSNSLERISNLELFGGVDSIRFVFVIQLQTTTDNSASSNKKSTATSALSLTTSLLTSEKVHNRNDYLQRLIPSLSKVEAINESLLIFSHDLDDDHINRAIGHIQFARVLQIFYPFSTELYPDRFPGKDSKSCPAKIGTAKAKLMKCNNWQSPDMYGHYREAHIVQVKHHWWWKMNYVFSLRCLKDFKGGLIRLEEDNLVSSDILLAYQLLLAKQNESVDLLALGNYQSFLANANEYGIAHWYSSTHNLGTVFLKRAWKKIQSCSNFFCTYDDYNWDWSMTKLSAACLESQLTVAYLKRSRVLHIGRCGLHFKDCRSNKAGGNDYSLVEDRTKLKQDPKNGTKRLNDMILVERSTVRLKTTSIRANGGWSDPRDFQLCKENTLLL